MDLTATNKVIERLPAEMQIKARARIQQAIDAGCRPCPDCGALEGVLTVTWVRVLRNEAPDKVCASCSKKYPRLKKATKKERMANRKAAKNERP
jgi:hypothetical protein